MNTQYDTSTPQRVSPSRGTSRKVRALLAGGLVLGVGAAITLAAWNDSEYATGTFTSGTFEIEGTADVVSLPYVAHPSESPAVLEFTVPDLAANLTPGDVVYTPYWIRLTEDSTINGALSVASVTTLDVFGSNSSQMSYEVWELSLMDVCDSTASVTGSLLASADSLSSGSPTISNDADLQKGSGSPGEAVQLCVAVTAGSGLQQGGETVSTWRFQAESVDLS